MRNTRITSLVLTLCWGTIAIGQVNERGTIHASVGIAAGAHATQYEQTLFVAGIPYTSRDDDGAATVTAPIRVGYGFAKWFSLGLIVEPGAYLDSNATKSNALVMFGIEPRFYLLNKDHFAWMASLQLGGSSLTIDEQGTVITQAVYKGANIGLGTGVGFYFTDLVGLNVGVRYLANSLTLREFSTNGTGLNLDNFDAILSTRGVLVEAALAFKF